jgi:hypothetical protein
MPEMVEDVVKGALAASNPFGEIDDSIHALLREYSYRCGIGLFGKELL